MRHKTKLIEFVIILMAFFFISGCDPPDSDDDSGSVEPDSVNDNAGETPFTFGDPKIGGDGCPEGTYDIIIDDDQIHFKFYEFKAETTEGNKVWASADCGIIVAIEVLKNYQVGIGNAKYSGEAFIPSGGIGEFHRDYWFNAEEGPFITENIEQKNQYISWDFEDDGILVWSECGEDVIAHTSFTISAQRPSDSKEQAKVLFKDDAIIDLDFKWRPCKGSENAEPSADFSDFSE